ncbi:MAG: DUF4369 domain-containing protein, partial [Saprospiraceae bacterium]
MRGQHFSLLFLLIALLSCSQGKQITGDFNNAPDLAVSLDRIGLDNSGTPIDKSEMKGGKFKFSLKESPKPGLYKISMGQQNLIFVLDGTESTIDFNGNFNELGTGKVNVKGSDAS